MALNRKTPLKARTPLKQKTPLKAYTPLKAKTSLKAHTTLKNVSNTGRCRKTSIVTPKAITEIPFPKSTGGKKPTHKQLTAKKTKGPYWSIFTNDLSECFVTKTKYEDKTRIEPHHIFGGSRKTASEIRGFILPLRSDYHRATPYSIHENPEFALKYKKLCEVYYLEHYGTVEEFIAEFNKNYLEPEEIKKITELQKESVAI